MRYDLKLTATERKVLDAMWSAPDKVLRHAELNRLAGKTPRGARTVLNRMTDRSFLGFDRVNNGLTITFKGMQALGVTARGVM